MDHVARTKQLVADIVGAIESGGSIPPIDRSDDGGDDGDMEDRLREVEKAVIEIKAVLPTLATKEDLHKEIASNTRFFVGWVTTIGIGLVAAVYFIARTVH